MLQTNIKEKIFNLKMLMKNLKINEEKQGDFYKRQKSQCFKILHNSTQQKTTNKYLYIFHGEADFSCVKNV